MKVGLWKSGDREDAPDGPLYRTSILRWQRDRAVSGKKEQITDESDEFQLLVHDVVFIFGIPISLPPRLLSSPLFFVVRSFLDPLAMLASLNMADCVYPGRSGGNISQIQGLGGSFLG